MIERVESSESDVPFDVADTKDEDYNSPSAGGCWFCHRGNGFEDGDMRLDMELDTYYHPRHLEELEVDSVLEWEKTK